MSPHQLTTFTYRAYQPDGSLDCSSETHPVTVADPYQLHGHRYSNLVIGGYVTLYNRDFLIDFLTKCLGQMSVGHQPLEEGAFHYQVSGEGHVTPLGFERYKIDARLYGDDQILQLQQELVRLFAGSHDRVSHLS